MQLVIDRPRDGATNMAIDQALLESASVGDAVLRVYTWSEPTLSLGYFQPLATRSEHTASFPCPWVRRSSGGGAIVHDHELTYCLALPDVGVWSNQADGLYDLVHGTFIVALREQGIQVARVADSRSPSQVQHRAGSREDRAEPFLCFQRRALPDLVVGQHKIAGSAQRRWRGALMQHGSVLLSGSPFAPELPGLEQLAGGEFCAQAFRDRWLEALEGALKVEWTRSELLERHWQRVEELVRDRYGSMEWNHRR